MSLVLVALFAVLLALRVPIAVALGLPSLVVALLYDLPLSGLGPRAVNALNTTPLLAVPLFILAAALLNAAGVTGHVFAVVRMAVGRVRGGMAQVSVLVSLVFSGVSGAALADIGALGKMQVDEMVRQGYDRGFASGVTVAAATIGPIFPPSIPIIIYASVANVSAVKLLVAGILPALLIAVLLMAQIAWRARGGRLPKDDGTAAGAGALRTIGMAVPALLAPAIMIGGLLSGWFGPTEVAGVTVAYALLVGVLFYRSLTVRAVVDAFAETALAAANVLLVVSAAAMFAWILTLDRAPTVVGEALVALTTDPVMLLLLVNAMLLILGMVLESIAAILILAPIIAPALHMAGVDPLHLGIVFVLNLMIGLMTPPVGMSLYMVSIVTGTPVGRVIRGVLPFLAPLLLALLAVTFVPELATWLPGLLD